MAQIQHLDIGDYWQPVWTFKVGTTATDPTTLVYQKMDPAGVITQTTNSNPAALTGSSSPVARTSAGVYRYDILIDQAGDWYAKMSGTGAVVAAEQQEAIADPDVFTSAAGISSRALVTLGATKRWLEQNNIDTSDDLKIVQRINAASERISQVAGREFKPNGTNPETRIFDLGWNGNAVEIGDLQTATTASTTISVSQLETASLLRTFVATDYVAIPRNRKPWQPVTSIYFQRGSWGYNRPFNYLSVNGYWGFPSVPEDIKHATMDTVAYWLDRDVEHFRQDLGAGTGEAGQTVFVGGAPPTIYPVPPEAYRIAIGYRRQVVA